MHSPVGLAVAALTLLAASTAVAAPPARLLAVVPSASLLSASTSTLSLIRTKTLSSSTVTAKSAAISRYSTNGAPVAVFVTATTRSSSIVSGAPSTNLSTVSTLCTQLPALKKAADAITASFVPTSTSIPQLFGNFSSPSSNHSTEPSPNSAQYTADALTQAHGALMFVAWCVLAPAGIIAARFYKGTKHGETRWFCAHIVLFWTCFMCNVIAFALIYLAAQGDHFDVVANGAHVAIGPAVLALMALQMSTGYIINHFYVPTRIAVPWWDKGRIVFLLAVVNIPLGILLYSASRPSSYEVSPWLWGWFEAWLIAVAIAFAYLEGRKQVAQALQAKIQKLRLDVLRLPDSGSRNAHEPEPAGRTKPEEDGGWSNQKLSNTAATTTAVTLASPDVLAVRYLSFARSNADIYSTMEKDSDCEKTKDTLMRLYEGYESLIREQQQCQSHQQQHQEDAGIAWQRASNATASVETARAEGSWTSLTDDEIPRNSSCGDNRSVSFANTATEILSLPQLPAKHEIIVENGDNCSL
ncbi:DOMON domain-containing protein frrs1L [Entophlyctis sp. JEL0112]|nr:DOMON domain-containing protein frrs1L [Entophlyctis sp. JEL0112]